MKNRKGSAFILTLMVFVFLSILATATVSFMVSENKQSIYHKDKIQAYYIARSGVEAVEASILGMDDEEKEKLLKNLPKEVEIDGMNFEKGSLENISLKNESDSIVIESSAIVNNSREKVTKVMSKNLTENEEITITGPPIIATGSIGDNIGYTKDGNENEIYYNLSKKINQSKKSKLQL